MGLRQNKITVGHARALINIEDPETQRMIYQQILRYDFSVRKVEDIVRQLNSEDKKTLASIRHYKKTKELKQLKEDLTKKLNCKVDIKKTNLGTGKIILHFENEIEFENIIHNLTKK